MNLAVYVGGFVAFLVPDSVQLNPIQVFFPSLTNLEFGCGLLLMAIYLTPYILYPCCVDHFPSWLCRRYGDEKMSRIARGIYGVESR